MFSKYSIQECVKIVKSDKLIFLTTINKKQILQYLGYLLLW